MLYASMQWHSPPPFFIYLRGEVERVKPDKGMESSLVCPNGQLSSKAVGTYCNFILK